jgi:endogenous inhibitor of DNA gyrase (YacG/DUF329 family)
MEWAMAELMIRCPKTGKPVTTGIHIDRARFRAMPVFFSSSYCPSCGTSHEWFARDAWMCEPEAEMSNPAHERKIA